MAVELSPEQEEFLKQCEEAFPDRYTEKDEEYMESVNKGISDPPVVSPWYQRGGNRNDNSRHQGKRRYDGDYDRRRSYQRPREDSYNNRDRNNHSYQDY